MDGQPGDQRHIDHVTAQQGSRVVVAGTLVGDIRMDSPRSPAQIQDERNRLVAIRRVRSNWIDGVLNQSLYRRVRLELRAIPDMKAVDSPLNVIVQVPDRAPVVPPAGTSIVDLFEAHHHALVILGDPGTGKTTLLLELARTLLDRAEQNYTLPIPVVFNLSTWAQKRRSLDKWMVESLSLFFDIPRSIGSRWVSQGLVAPLLDGLDEVEPAHRLACLDAICAFRSTEAGQVPIAVCSRTAEYQELSRKLRLSGAVVVQPPTQAQINECLDSGGDQLKGLRDAVKANPLLAELVQTPLMLWVAILAHQNDRGCEIATGDTMESTRSRLFASYVDTMLLRRAPVVRFGRKNTIKWLSSLARLLQHNQISIFTLESLKPQMVHTRPGRWCAYATVVLVTTVGFILWSFVTNVVAYTASQVLLLSLGYRDLTWQGWTDQLDYAFLVALFDMIFIGAIGGILGSVFDIHASERIEFRLSGLRSRLLSGLKIFAAVTGLLTAIGGLDLDVDSKPVSLIGLGCALVALLFGEVTDSRTRPNEGTIRSFKTAVWTTASVVAVGLGAALHGGLHRWLLPAAAIAGFAGGLFTIRHYATRLFLWLARVAPLRYIKFLDHASERLLLRKVGNGYVFAHRLLLEYFASLR